MKVSQSLRCDRAEETASGHVFRLSGPRMDVNRYEDLMLSPGLTRRLEVSLSLCVCWELPGTPLCTECWHLRRRAGGLPAGRVRTCVRFGTC